MSMKVFGCFSFLICASSFPFLASKLQDVREGCKEKKLGIEGKLICILEYSWSFEHHFKASSVALRGSALMLLKFGYLRYS